MENSNETSKMIGLQKLYQMYQKAEGTRQMSFDEWLEENNY